MGKFFAMLLVFGFVSLAQTAPSFAESDAKLDQILQNQNQILSKLQDIQRELEIVKVRATRA